MSKFIRSPFFLLLIIGLLIFATAIFNREKQGYSEDNPHHTSSNRPTRKAIETYFEMGKQHNTACIQYLAPVLEKYYLQRNITRENTLPFNYDWWQKYPYEEFNIDWNSMEETDLGNGNTQFRTNMNYCKGKTATTLNCKDISLIIKVNEDNQIYYLANK